MQKNLLVAGHFIWLFFIMVKFGKNLYSMMVREWSHCYVNYKKLKELISEHENANSLDEHCSSQSDGEAPHPLKFRASVLQLYLYNLQEANAELPVFFSFPNNFKIRFVRFPAVILILKSINIFFPFCNNY